MKTNVWLRSLFRPSSTYTVSDEKGSWLEHGWFQALYASSHECCCCWPESFVQPKPIHIRLLELYFMKSFPLSTASVRNSISKQLFVVFHTNDIPRGQRGEMIEIESRITQFFLKITFHNRVARLRDKPKIFQLSAQTG